MKPFDPLRLLKETSNDLLRELFTRLGARLNVPWDDLKQRDVAPIVLLWETMPEAERRRVHVILQEVQVMTSERGLKVLAQQLEWQQPELARQYSVREGRFDKALWAYLFARDAFDQAAIFACADELARGRFWNRWNGLPHEAIEVTPVRLKSLEDELRKYYWPRELRGRHCRVHHYPRCNGVDYFFAYLDDWPDRLLAFDDDGEMATRSERYAFTNVFAYNADEGCIDLVAKGGRKVHARLRQAFCRSILNRNVSDSEPVLPVYQLDHLLDPHLTLPTAPDDRVAVARITRIRIAPQLPVDCVQYEELGFSTHATLEMVISEIRERVADRGLTPELLQVLQARFQLQFMGGDPAGVAEERLRNFPEGYRGEPDRRCVCRTAKRTRPRDLWLKEPHDISGLNLFE